MKVLYFASVRDRLKTDADDIRIEKPVTVAEFFARHIQPRLGIGPERLLFAVNEEMVDTQHILRESDTLAILPPLSGGTGMARLQTGDFDMDEETALCVGGRKDIGGIATFTGMVRDNAKGKRIERIELTCYERMAQKELEKLRARAIEKFGVMNVTIVHRIGILRPGERIVGIVAAGGHRGEAFDACRWTIDELKKTVPIWKKEVTADGESWVEGL